MNKTRLKITIRPEPWDPGIAHRIAARARAMATRIKTRFGFTHGYGKYFVTVTQDYSSHNTKDEKMKLKITLKRHFRVVATGILDVNVRVAGDEIEQKKLSQKPEELTQAWMFAAEQAINAQGAYGVGGQLRCHLDLIEEDNIKDNGNAGS